MAEASMVFDDLPLVEDKEHKLRVHQTRGLFFVKRGGTAHADMNCGHLSWTDLVDNRDWRVATDA